MIEVKLEQLVKGLRPIVVTLYGITIEVSPLQPLNAPLFIVITLLGISIAASLLWLENALSPIDFTVLGIVLFEQPAINSFVTVSMIALQLSLESNTTLPSSTIIEVKPEQYEKTPLPIVVKKMEFFGVI